MAEVELMYVGCGFAFSTATGKLEARGLKAVVFFDALGVFSK